MFDNMQRVRELQKVVQDPTESEYVQALVTIITTLEHRQLQAVEELHDAHDIDGLDVQANEDQRRQQLLDLVNAVASGEFRSWWFDAVIGQHIDNPDDAMAYAGLDDDEWQDQIERWAATWRDRGGEEFEQHTDQDLARLHVERKFGVSLREFEREVVNYDQQDAMRTVLAGNFEAVEQGIRAATEAAEEQGGDDGE